MYYILRPIVFFMNLAFLLWFFALQYYRFKNTGRACSGDFVLGSSHVFNYNDEKLYLVTEGKWMVNFIIMQYLVFFIGKFAAIYVSNDLEGEFESIKQRQGLM